jgi:gliding motility-associated-like protein
VKRLEDRLKDHFDHFQPEVDPAVWQQISQQLPKGPGPAPTVKGVSSFAGSKVLLIAGGLAAVVTAGVLIYRTLVTGDESLPAATPSTSEQIDIEVADPVQENISAPVQLQKQTAGSPGPNETSSELSSSTDQKSPLDGQGPLNHQPAGQTALTGQTGPENGGTATVPPTPATPSKAEPNSAVNTSETNPSGPTGSIQSATEKPVLILSSRHGFAPFTVTCMTNMQDQTADFDFGDGNTTYGKTSATHRYDESGTFEITCTVNQQVLKSTITVTGRIPSAFSPNGDGVNDRFRIDNPENLPIELRIFSRSGQLLFSARGTDISWDGRTPAGDPAAPGTYLYSILAPSFEGSQNQQKGTIQLFR